MATVITTGFVRTERSGSDLSDSSGSPTEMMVNANKQMKGIPYPVEVGTYRVRCDGLSEPGCEEDRDLGD